MYEFCIYFLIFSFLGWCSEVCFAAYKEGRFVNRGFLNGPVCPIYGFGVAGVHFVTGLIENDALLVVVSFLLPTLLELVTGFVLEKVFHHKWWDYSNEHWNVGGYICAKFSLLWGLVCIVVVKIVFPLIDKLIAVLPVAPAKIIVAILLVVATVDFLGTIGTIVNLNNRLKAIDALNAKIHTTSDKIGKPFAEGTIALISAKDKLMKNTSVFVRRIVAAFPSMSTKKYKSFLELKSVIAERKAAKRAERDAQNTKEENK